MTDTFFINNQFTVTQNTLLYVDDAVATGGDYDYSILINVAEDGLGLTMNDLFFTSEIIA